MDKIIETNAEVIEEGVAEVAKTTSFVDFLKACARIGIPVAIAVLLWKKVIKPGIAARKAAKEMAQTTEDAPIETEGEVVDSEE